MPTLPKPLPPIITIDGPSASGKGTIAKLLAQRLGFVHVDSGLLYRLYAYLYGQRVDKVEEFASLHIHMQADTIELVSVDGTETFPFAVLRTEQIGNLASDLASVSEVRHCINTQLYTFVVFPGVVADGRDMGTIVFPDAAVKIFLTAQVGSRAYRRFVQLGGIDAGLDKTAVQQQLQMRDDVDRARTISPLVIPKGAAVIDSSYLSEQETLAAVGLVVADVLGEKIFSHQT